MSNTYLATVPHYLIQKKPWLAYHAAVQGTDGWTTACGELFGQGILHDRDRLNALMAGTVEGTICKRCDRVGESIL